MSLTEPEVHKSINGSFIDRNPFYVSFTRLTMVPDGAGGKVQSGPTTLDAQKVRLVGQPRPGTIVTTEGRQVVVDLALVGMPDLDVELEDEFTVAGRKYEVVNIDDQPSWRVIVQAVRRG